MICFVGESKVMFVPLHVIVLHCEAKNYTLVRFAILNQAEV